MFERKAKADYWQARYIQAVLSTHAEPSPDARRRYRKLAEHYLAMIKCVDPAIGSLRASGIEAPAIRVAAAEG